MPDTTTNNLKMNTYTYTLAVENIKCHGCEQSITNGLKKADFIKSVTVDAQASTVTIVTNQNQKDYLMKIDQILTKLGYPLKGNNNLLHKSKSFISCARGRFKS